MTDVQVRVWEEDVEIPTYGIGEPDKNPMFLEKRVYQGSSGKVYPHPVIDKVFAEKTTRMYRLLCLENEYLHIEIMPELGGRIYRALDKTNNYDFVYYNRVIKPALVGLTGPWISGGIEFNWPQHHRPNTFGPVEHLTSVNADGSATVWVSEIDRMYGTKMTAGFTLYPGKAYLAIEVQLYNRTPEPQTFLWWANPAYAVNDQTQSIFPPDVHAVFDHGRRAVSAFPIARGTYYKVDYSAGVDISRYKNIPVPMSYMTDHSNYDFIGGYDYGKQAGLLHIANHHISPGKKQWTWGCGEFGQAWDRNLTDEDGPYIELMTGVYADNQPDFSWLQPYEEKTFTQYFMPYKEISGVKNASIDAALNLEIDRHEHSAWLAVYATSFVLDAHITLVGVHQTYLDVSVTLSPTQIFTRTVSLDVAEQAEDLRVKLHDQTGRLLLSYQPEPERSLPLPEPAQVLPAPEQVTNNEALYLAGLHLEQYRHATFVPDDYYLEGLKRDPQDIRINVAYGMLLLRRGLFAQSEQHFRTAIQTLTRHNPNPYDSEAYYQLGAALKWQGRLDEATTAFYKATWSEHYKAVAFFSLAQIACANSAYAQALELVERSLVHNAHNYKALHLQVVLYRKLHDSTSAKHVLDLALQLDRADFGARYERHLLLLEQDERSAAVQALSDWQHFLRGDPHNYLTLAADYAQAGLYQEAWDVLHHLVVVTSASEITTIYPMVYYYLAAYAAVLEQSEQVACYLQSAQQAPTDYCFPNSLDDLVVLQQALQHNPQDARAHYYLGNLLYDKQRQREAIAQWEAARALDEGFATVHRNLALAYFNILGEPERARLSLEKAFACDPSDARVLYELDQFYLRIGRSPEERLATLDAHAELIEMRDDLYLAYVTLHNTLQQYERASELLAQRTFHPWEGGEGKVPAQYRLALVERAKLALSAQLPQQALSLLSQARHYPEHLGEGKLAGTQENDILYYSGCAYELLGELKQATQCFEQAALGLDEPTSAMFYNDQPPDMIFYQGLALRKLGDEDQAQQRFQKLLNYGQHHQHDHVQIDYFAVSLPDFLVFENDLDRNNAIHCCYMCGLGYLGLQAFEQARTLLDHVLELNPNHQGARVHLDMCHFL